MSTWFWSSLLAGFGVVGLALAGRRSYWGWALGLADEGLWVVYGVRTGQWSFCLSAAAYSWVYARNLLKWRRSRDLPDTPAEATFPVASGKPAVTVAGAGSRVRMLILVVVGALAGCGQATTTWPAHSTSAPSAGSPADQARQARLADFRVRQAYEEYWYVVALLDSQPAQRRRGVMSVVAVDPELTRQLAHAQDRAARRVHLFGEPTLHITEVSGAMTTAAVLIDCQDAAGFGEADRTGQPITAGPPAIQLVARLERDSDVGTWRVADVRAAGVGCRPTPAPPTARGGGP